jgi:hypothetical protein
MRFVNKAGPQRGASLLYERMALYGPTYILASGGVNAKHPSFWVSKPLLTPREH